ncbi:hypothetical protein GUJ93_ZPchr0006g44278 [Zizania palustris]|uniref:Uncharacterized protein n=1 Tax=Zizania palustris TaxID=103762 RepID=A0A8J5S604_ZIZPA|nr:hypothetical protein GUJ93_ZPchr0006g44278 [Zizania palustris]
MCGGPAHKPREALFPPSLRLAIHPSRTTVTAPGGPSASMASDAMVDQRWVVKTILDGIRNRFGDEDGDQNGCFCLHFLSCSCVFFLFLLDLKSESADNV